MNLPGNLLSLSLSLPPFNPTHTLPSQHSQITIPYSLSLSLSLSTMKLMSKINPKNLFRSKKKTRSMTRSNPSSFSSSTDSPNTPTSVLPTTSDDVAETFKMMDRDGDGKIDLSRLEQILTRIGPDPPNRNEVKLMLTEIDADGDGCISLEELGAVGPAFDPTTAAGHELRDAFAFFDADRDGRITAEELREVFAAVLGDEGCTLEECRRMVAEVGKSGEGGFVCFDDFLRMMELQR